MRMPSPQVRDKPKRSREAAERTLSFVDAVREAAEQEMLRDESVIVFGLDVDDPKAIQGTTRGLAERFGPERVFGTPPSEDAMAAPVIASSESGVPKTRSGPN